MQVSFKCNAVILCGGKSSRMGQDKSLLKIQEKTLAELMQDKLTPYFKEIFFSLKEPKFDFKAKIIQDKPHETYSPMLALYSILERFDDEFVFIIAVDFVRFSIKELELLSPFLKQDYRIIIPQTKDFKHSLCGFYHSSLAPLCKNFLEQDKHKISLLFSQTKTKFVDFESEDAFLNLNFYPQFQKFNEEFHENATKR